MDLIKKKTQKQLNGTCNILHNTLRVFKKGTEKPYGVIPEGFISIHANVKPFKRSNSQGKCKNRSSPIHTWPKSS